MTTKILGSFAELQKHLAADQKNVIHATGKGLGEAAKRIRDNAINRVLADPLSAVGLCDSIKAEQAGLEAVVGTNDPTAATQEFGTASTPPHPFLAPAALETEEATKTIFAEAVVSAFTRK